MIYEYWENREDLKEFVLNQIKEDPGSSTRRVAAKEATSQITMWHIIRRF